MLTFLYNSLEGNCVQNVCIKYKTIEDRTWQSSENVLIEQKENDGQKDRVPVPIHLHKNTEKPLSQDFLNPSLVSGIQNIYIFIY